MIIENLSTKILSKIDERSQRRYIAFDDFAGYNLASFIREESHQIFLEMFQS